MSLCTLPPSWTSQRNTRVRVSCGTWIMSTAHDQASLRPSLSKPTEVPLTINMAGACDTYKVNNPMLGSKSSQLRDKSNQSPLSTPIGRGAGTFNGRNNINDLPTPPLTPTGSMLSSCDPTASSSPGLHAAVPQKSEETSALIGKPLHAANLHLLKCLLYRLVAGMRQSFAPLLDKGRYLYEVAGVSTRQELSRLMRQLATRLSKQALQPAFWDSYKELLEPLFSDPYFDVYVSFLSSVYHGCRNHAVQMERWWLEVDRYPFEYALGHILDQRGLSRNEDDETTQPPALECDKNSARAEGQEEREEGEKENLTARVGTTREDDETCDLTGGVSVEGIEALFEQKRRDYTVLDVMVENGNEPEASGSGDGACDRLQQWRGGEGAPRQQGGAKAEGTVLYYRFVIQRGDGRCLSVVRRYSDVFSLMTRLEGPLPCVLTPFLSPTFRTPDGHDFPGKSLHRTGDAATAEHRRTLFKQYIHAVLRERDVHLSEPLCTFLAYTPPNGYAFRVPRTHNWDSDVCPSRAPFPWPPSQPPSLRSHESLPHLPPSFSGSLSLSHPWHTHNHLLSHSSMGSTSSLYSNSAVFGSYTNTGSAFLGSAALTAHLDESSDTWAYRDE